MITGPFTMQEKTVKRRKKRKDLKLIGKEHQI